MNQGDDVWRAWFDRWERFQECYVPARDSQFEVMLEYVGRASGSRTPAHVVDLCSGPGSIAQRARRRFGDAVVTAVDLDPWLVELGRRCAQDSRLLWRVADLRAPGWSEEVARPVDAALSATAMHWFDGEQLGRIYADVAAMLEPGGIFLNADIVPAGDGTAIIARAGLELLFRWQAARTRTPGCEDWVSFWRAARCEPEFTALLAERERLLGLRPPRVFLPFTAHAELLRAAGFTQITEVWRFHAAAIVAAVY